MNTTFADMLNIETNHTATANGADCLGTTGNGLVDLFAVIGALRDANTSRKCKLFDRAVADNKELAAKILFYGRDIREGLGERDTFRILLAYAADKYPEIVKPNISLIGFYGRFDDLYCLIGTKCENDMWKAMKQQFDLDLTNMAANKPVSLLAKWIKTPNASSKNTRAYGILTSQKLGYKNVGEFLPKLKALRKYLDIVEIKISANSLETINYSSVPSNAMKKYRCLFKEKDELRFSNFIEDVKSGNTAIHAGTLYPYDIVRNVLHDDYDEVLEEQWKALPNYVENGDNILVVSDVSGSMYCCNDLPISTSIGLGIYFAERCSGPFHNKFMTFSAKPQLVEVYGSDLADKISNMNSAAWGMNTNLDEVFRVVLETAQNNNVSKDELPKAIVIISDMQIDSCLMCSKDFHSSWKKQFEENGYALPNVIFWNVNSESDVFFADTTRQNVQYLSGHSVNAFKSLLTGLNKTPIEAMLETILSDRYAAITIAA